MILIFLSNFVAVIHVYMGKELIKPDYVFESSWEVCNKVGGI